MGKQSICILVSTESHYSRQGRTMLSGVDLSQQRLKDAPASREVFLPLAGVVGVLQVCGCFAESPRQRSTRVV